MNKHVRIMLTTKGFELIRELLIKDIEENPGRIYSVTFSGYNVPVTIRRDPYMDKHFIITTISNGASYTFAVREFFKVKDEIERLVGYKLTKSNGQNTYYLDCDETVRCYYFMHDFRTFTNRFKRFYALKTTVTDRDWCEIHKRYELFASGATAVYERYVDNGDVSYRCCEEALKELGYEMCPECGNYFKAENMVDVEFTDYYGELINEGVCRHCADTNFHRCLDCGTIIRNGYDYCYRCRGEHELYTQCNDYSTKPSPKFLGDTYNSIIDGYLGFELEIENNEYDEYDEMRDEVCENICSEMDKEVYCKHDGSLNETGIEIVSHPMTLEYLMSRKNDTSRLFDYLLGEGYESHNTDHCGLHFHVSRTALGDDPDLVEVRIMYVIEKFWEEIVRFTRRKRESIERWASRNNSCDFKVLENACKYQKDYGHSQRYHALNVTNEDTIEFRIFRGTLKLNTFIASAQFCAVVVKYCLEHTNEELIDCTWRDLVKSDYEELNTYLAERNL